MNRRDAAMIAHLDAIESRLTGYLMQIIGELARVREDIAGMKLEHVTHRHEDDQ